MARYRYPLSELLPEGLLPAGLLEVGDRSVLELIGVLDYRVRSTDAGVFIGADLGIVPGAGRDPEVVLALPQFPDLGVVLRTLGRLEVWVQEDFTVRLSLGAFSLRLPPALLKPVREKADGGWEPDPEREYVEVELAYQAADGIASPYPFVVTIDRRGRLDLDLPFLDGDGAPIRPVASLNGRAMIDDTGVVIDVQQVSFNLDPEDPWLAFEEAEVILPPELTGALVLPRIRLENARLSRRGLSGSATATWPLELDVGRFVYRLDDGPREAQLFGLSGGLGQLAVSLEENRLVAFEASGGLVVPYFDEPVEVRLDVQPSGDFVVTLLGIDADGITLRKEELLALNVKSLSLVRRGDVGEVSVSGGLEPLLMASDGLQWPRLGVTDLTIDTQGHFRIREAWIDLKDLATLDLFGFHFELTRIGLGSEEARDRLWVDLSGSLRLIEQIPVGLGVEGFRLSWPRNLDELLQISTPPTLDDSLAILGELEVRFDGIYLFFGVPDAVEFEGLIRFIKTAEVVGFAGDVALRVPATGLAAEAGLMVGMNFEPPPYPFLYVYFGVELPAGIPLGQSGLALKGALGLFGLNVSPAKAPEENWYYDWYKRPIVGAHPTNKWQPERSALSFGAGLTITTADGYVKGTRGLLVFSIPGPILIIEGRALLLSGLGPGEPPLRALAVFDGREQTAQFNIEARAELVEGLLEASGGLEAFFDFKDVTNWHLYLGQDEPEDRRIQANVFELPGDGQYLFNANGYYMVDMLGAGTLRSRMGVFVGLKQDFTYDPVTIGLDAWIEGAGLVTVRPEQFSGDLELGASVKVSAFGFGLQLAASAAVMGEGPEPFRVEATVAVSVDLPAPLEDVEAEFELAWESVSLRPEFPLVGAVADSDFIPIGGKLDLDGTILLQRDGDIAERLRASEGRLAESAAQDKAEQAPVVPLDARPTLMFAHDMNDATGAHFARDPRDAVYRIGRLALTPVLREVTVYRHPRAAPWTGDFATDWELLASSDPDAIAGEDQRLWGVWLAEAAADDPSVPAARRLRLWTGQPFVYARRGLGRGYQRIFLLQGPRVSYPEEFLRDYPTYLECRGTEPAEVCFDFADAPVPKDDPGAAQSPQWSHRGVVFTGAAHLEPRGDGSAGVCLAVRGLLLLRFPAPVVRVRLTFCRDPQRSASAVRGLLAVRRDAESPRPGSAPAEAACAIDVPYEVQVDGRTWTVAAAAGFDCLQLRRPAPLEALCCVTAAEAGRAARAAEQCARNDDAVAHLDDPAVVLQPGAYYRIVVKSTVDGEVVPAPGSSPLAGALDLLYDAALSALTGSGTSVTVGFLQEAFFRTEGPPRSLAPYVKWSSPEPQATRVFRDDDLAVRFRRATLQAMFGAPPHRLEVVVRDAEGRPAAGYETHWGRAAGPTLLPDEQVWLEHLDDAPTPPPDDVLEVRRPVLFADDFDDPGLRGWDVLEFGGRQPAGSPWRVVDGELRCTRPLFGGSVARGDLAKPGPMVVANTPALRATGSPRDLVVSVDLRSDQGEAIGVVVGYARPGTYYRFSMDDRQRYRRLVKVTGGQATLLFETADGFARDEPHEVEIALGADPGGGRRLRVWLDGRAWCDVVDRSQPILSERVGLYCWRNGLAQFMAIRVRAAAAAAPALAPTARYELTVVDTAGAVLHRVPFVTSLYPRFRDLVLTFPGRAVDVPAQAPTAAAVDGVRGKMAAYGDLARGFERAVGQHRDQQLDRGRAGLEAWRLDLRNGRAALDAEFQTLASAIGISLFDPPPAGLEILTLRAASATDGSVAAFWLRSPETLDLRYEGPSGQAGRTSVALQRRTSADGPWEGVPATVLSDSDGLQALLVPAPAAGSASSATGLWIPGRYRATFTYRRNHGDEASPSERPYDRPVQKRLGTDAPERVSIDWLVT
jgi:hypothetical protein